MLRTNAEAALVAKLMAGDEAAFAQMVRDYGARLLATARRILHHEQDAQDATQEAFLAAAKSMHGFGARAALSTWLHRLVVNAALMQLRWRRCRPARSLDGLAVDAGGYHGASDGLGALADTPPADASEQAESRSRLRAEIATLKDSLRAVLTLRDLEQRSSGEVARKLGITTNAVKIRAHRARQALRARLIAVG